MLFVRKLQIIATFLAVIVGAPAAPDAQKNILPTVQVYKTPTCGCCSKWVDHMRYAGFTVHAEDVSQQALDAVKLKYGVPATVNSCHTARLAGYIVEGHIPADAVKKMLKERPKVVGIAVPGMPIGSPGMEIPGVRAQQYDVLSFDKTGATKVFLTIKP
jgi:hypothetical protein